MSTVFVTGLPRTRSYWFSRFLDSLPGVRAYHELSGHVTSPEQMEVLMTPTPGSHSVVVNCDTGLWITDWRQRFPDAMNIRVNRTVDSTVASLEAALLESGLAMQEPEVIRTALQMQADELDQMDWEMEIDFHSFNVSIIPVLELIGIELPDTESLLAFCEKNLTVPEFNTSQEAYDMWRRL